VLLLAIPVKLLGVVDPFTDSDLKKTKFTILRTSNSSCCLNLLKIAVHNRFLSLFAHFKTRLSNKKQSSCKKKEKVTEKYHCGDDQQQQREYEQETSSDQLQVSFWRKRVKRS
jgi:hypothetical protein